MTAALPEKYECIPQMLKLFIGEGSVPELLAEGQWKGELVWGTVYVVFVMCPLSLPKNIGSLGYFSTLGWMWALYITLWFVLLFVSDRALVPSIGDSVAGANYFETTLGKMSRAIPFIVFSYMYQPVVPVIYTELKNRSRSKMRKILACGSVFVIFVYIIDAAFGYLWAMARPAFVATLIEQTNILKLDFGSWLYNIAVLGFLFTVFASAQVNFLAAKSEFELIFFDSTEMSKLQNAALTLCFCLICWTLAVFVPQISDSITVLGCTVDPFSGFILPIVFYLKIFKKDAQKNWKVYLETKICWVLLVFISWISAKTLLWFIIDKFNS